MGQNVLDIITQGVSERLYLDLSKMPENERGRIKGLQELLGLETFDEAFAIEGAVMRVIDAGEKPPYKGWFPKITGKKREKLIEYIEQTKREEVDSEIE